MNRVNFHPKATKELRKLDNTQKQFVQKAVRKIERYGMETGKPLRGTLKGCRKLKHQKLGLRIIFKEENRELKIIQVLAIGQREDSVVYKEAEKRIE